MWNSFSGRARDLVLSPRSGRLKVAQQFTAGKEGGDRIESVKRTTEAFI